MKKKKKSSCGIILFFSIVILILMAIIVLILTDVITLNNNTIENDVYGIKLDNSKDFIYKANYSYDNKYKKYDRKKVEKDEDIIIDKYGFEIKYNSKTQILSDLVVPHVNINTMDATLVNNEIEDLYISYAEEFDKCANEENEVGCVQILKYYSYIYEDILSIVIVDGNMLAWDLVFNYSVYNFDLKNGVLIKYNDFLEKLDYSQENVSVNINKIMEKNLNDKYLDDTNKLDNCKFTLDGKEKIDTCLNASKLMFENEVKNDKALYFVNDKGILNILAFLYENNSQNDNMNRYLFEIAK